MQNIFQLIRDYLNAPILAAIDDLIFTLRGPEDFSVKQTDFYEETIMGKTVKVFSYLVGLAAAGEKVASQTLNCIGVFDTPEQPYSDFEGSYGPEAKEITIKAVEGATIMLRLGYTGTNGVKSAFFVEKMFHVVDELAPEVPEDALTAVQTGCETVELPDEEQPIEPSAPAVDAVIAEIPVAVEVEPIG